MKIAVFGASGRTGKPLIVKALQQGHSVKVLVRNPVKLDVKHPNLELVQGDITDAQKVEATIEGTQAVISVLGRVKGSPKDLQTAATKNIVSAMKKLGINRLISLTGGGVRDLMDQPKFIDKFVVFLMKNLTGAESRHTLEDAINHAEVIKSTNLDWTIVRGPRLTEKPGSGKYKHGNIGKDSGIMLSREDLADFILKELKEGAYIKSMPFVWNT